MQWLTLTVAAAAIIVAAAAVLVARSSARNSSVGSSGPRPPEGLDAAEHVVRVVVDLEPRSKMRSPTKVRRVRSKPKVTPVEPSVYEQAERAVGASRRAAVGEQPWHEAHQLLEVAYSAGSRDPQLLIELARCCSSAARDGSAAFADLTIDSLLAEVGRNFGPTTAFGQLAQLERLIAAPSMATPEDLAFSIAVAKVRPDATALRCALASLRLSRAGASRIPRHDLMDEILGEARDPESCVARLAVSEPNLVNHEALTPLLKAIAPAALLPSADDAAAVSTIFAALFKRYESALRPLHGTGPVGLPVEIGRIVEDDDLFVPNYRVSI